MIPLLTISSVYIFAQFVGAIIGAALAYAQYIHAIDLFEGGRGLRTKATASLFVSYPVSEFKLYSHILEINALQMDYMTAVSSFFSEFLGTAILAFVIMAATDKGNAPPPSGLLPLVVLLTLLGLSLGLGMQTCKCCCHSLFSPRSHGVFLNSIFIQSCPRLRPPDIFDDGRIRRCILISSVSIICCSVIILH